MASRFPRKRLSRKELKKWQTLAQMMNLLICRLPTYWAVQVIVTLKLNQLQFQQVRTLIKKIPIYQKKSKPKGKRNLCPHHLKLQERTTILKSRVQKVATLGSFDCPYGTREGLIWSVWARALLCQNFKSIWPFLAKLWPLKVWHLVLEIQPRLAQRNAIRAIVVL